MASQSKSATPKLCPRCGAFYQDLPSKTCPQCFAKLELLDDETASALIEEQERRASDPTILEAKTVEDEKFKEQAFGGCMKVVGIALLTVVVCILIIVIGSHHYHDSTIRISVPQTGAPVPVAINLPKTLNGSQQTSVDESLVLPGSTTHIEHAVYASGIQVYAIPSVGINDDQLSAFQLAVSFAAKQHVPEYQIGDIYTQNVHFELLAQTNAELQSVSDELRRK